MKSKPKVGEGPDAVPNALPSGMNPTAPVFQPPTSTALWTSSSQAVLLQTAQAVVSNPDDPQRSKRVRIVLDGGSQRSYITEQLKTELSVRPVAEQNMRIVTFGAKGESSRKCDLVNVSVELSDGRMSLFTLYVVPLICEPLACQPVTFCQDQFEHLKGLTLADPSDVRGQLSVDILIGSDQYWSLVTGETRRGEEGPIGIHTELGWVLSGPACLLVPGQAQTTLVSHALHVGSHLHDMQVLEEHLKSFWDLESFGIIGPEHSVLDEFQDSIHFTDGRYEVSLPWKDPHQLLPDNYQLCVRRLQGLLRRLRQDPKLLLEYDSIIKNQLQRGIVEVVNLGKEQAERIHYLPHHAVVRHDKDTTKIRIVYDASARSTGLSLNDCLHAGPKFDQKIFDLLLRFRVHKVSLVADIEKAFLMVAVAERDRDALRFLWVSDILVERSELLVLRFARVVFGVSSSPFLLNATIRHHLKNYTSTQPDVVDKLLRSFYVDDVVTGTSDEDEAYMLYRRSKKLLKEGGFNLRKFCSNSVMLQTRIDSDEGLPNCRVPSTAPVEEAEESYVGSTLGPRQETHLGEKKVLGIRWDATADQFVMSVEDIASEAAELEPTKRTIVSLTGRFYDPLGFLSPIVIRFKIFLQELCEAKLSWDQPLTGRLLEKWHCMSSNLCEEFSLMVPRCYLNGIGTEVLSASLCGFGDSSLKAYAAVVYIRLTTTSGCHVRYLASKTRVSPLKNQTIPRLELLAALLLARLISSVTEALESELSLSDPCCFSDSTVALYWIRGVEKSWKPFVQNRVAEIRKLLPPGYWVHCPG